MRQSKNSFKINFSREKLELHCSGSHGQVLVCSLFIGGKNFLPTADNRKYYILVSQVQNKQGIFCHSLTGSWHKNHKFSVPVRALF